MNDSMLIRFWGVRGSYPVTAPDAAGFGGDTPCVEICAGGQRVIFDAGTGIIALGQILARAPATETLLLLSHLHHDHTQGLPFFAPLYDCAAHLRIYAPAFSDAALEKYLTQIISPPHFPLHWSQTAARKIVRRIADRAALEWNPTPDAPALTLRGFFSPAHPGGIMLYRLEWRGRALVYATDIEGYAYADRRLIEFARDADILIHDAQYTTAEYLGENGTAKQGWGHSTAAMALDVAQAAHVRQLVLFHHDPRHDDDTIAQIVSQTSSPTVSVVAARQGMTLECGAGKMTDARAFCGIDDALAMPL